MIQGRGAAPLGAILPALVVAALIIAPTPGSSWGVRSSSSDAATPSARLVRYTTLVIQTVPVLSGIEFLLDGTPYVTGANGQIRITEANGRHELIPVGAVHPLPGESIQFRHWGESSRPTDWLISLPGDHYIQAGFSVSLPIRLEFVGPRGETVPDSEIRQVVVTGSTGSQFSFPPQHPPSLLVANYIGAAPRAGIFAVPIRYSIKSVVFDSGGNAVFAGKQNFYFSSATRTSTVLLFTVWKIHLLLYRLHIAVQDAFFGFGIGKDVKVIFPDGHGRLFELGTGHAVTLASLPRSVYEVVGEGDGIGLTATVALTRPETARVLMLSYYDLGVAAAVFLLFLGGLPLLGRRLLGRGSKAAGGPRRRRERSGRTSNQ